MNVDKSLYMAPRGLADVADADDQAQDIIVEIVDPESVHIMAGGVEIDIDSDDDSDEKFSENLAETLDEGVLESIASELASDIDNDLNSRRDWEQMYKDGITLLGLKIEDRVEPWDGACGVFHPMLTEAIVRFQSETIMETFPARGPVRTVVFGKETPEKKQAASNVEVDMNFELTEKMPEFRIEHERMLWNLPGAGSAFKKVYFDPTLNRQTSVFIPAEDVIIPYGTGDIRTCHRLTHRMRKHKNDIHKLMNAGFYRDIDLGEPQKFMTEIQDKKDSETGFTATYDERFELYEAHVDLDIEGLEDTDEDGHKTGIALPYVVTMVRGTNEVLAVRRNWEEENPLKLKRDYFVHYQYIPGYGSYGFGLFHLIGGFAKAATSITRQLVDAGTLSNLPGGLKARGLRIKGDDTPISPGEFRDVDLGAGNIRDNILMLPYKEPSAVLAALLDKIIEEGRKLGAAPDMKISDMSAQSPVGTTLAILERTLKVMSAVQARVHYAFKEELQLLAGIIRDYTPEDYEYDPDSGGRRSKRDDYNHVDVLPVSDPNAATMSQRVVQYQAAIQLAQSAPQIYNQPLLHRQMLEVIGIKNAEKLVPMDSDQVPTDPVSENQNALIGKPIKAFAYQDHESHIAVHTSAMQDPLVQKLIGQNPMANQIMAAMQTHIAEHVGFAYRGKIEKALGVALPSIEDKLPPDVEKQISALMAQAAPQVLADSQALVAQQQAQQNAQDPVLQIQQQELQIKQGELQIKQGELALKQKHLEVDAAYKADELKLIQSEIETKAHIESMRIGATTAQAKETLETKSTIDGLRLGADIGSKRAASRKAKATPPQEGQQ